MSLIGLKQAIAEATALAGGNLCAAGHDWISDGGRSCPKDGIGKNAVGPYGGCSQTVYRCSRCGDYDYGDKGGPAYDECLNGCSYHPEGGAA